MACILIVDDEIEACNALKEFFLLRSHEVHIALDGKTALKMVKEISPHVVFLDIIMPGMWGIDVLREIKKIDPMINVIMVTAIGDEEIAEKSKNIGAYEYITKPFNLEYINKLLSKLIRTPLSKGATRLSKNIPI